MEHNNRERKQALATCSTVFSIFHALLLNACEGVEKPLAAGQCPPATPVGARQDALHLPS